MLKLPTPAPFYGSWQEAKHDSYNGSFYGFNIRRQRGGSGVGKSRSYYEIDQPEHTDRYRGDA